MKMKLESMLKNVNAAHVARKHLLLANVHDSHIHFLAKPGTQLGELSPASVLEGTNTIHEAERGVLLGALLGLAAGLMALAIPPWYTHSSWIVIIAITTVIGAISGAIGMAFLGGNLTNSDYDDVKNRIDEGEVLMIVSVPFYRIKEIRGILDKLNLKSH